jgi:hypothetical protein
LVRQDDRNDAHLRVEKRVIEQVDRGVQQLIIAAVPLRGLFSDLQGLPDLRTAIGLPKSFLRITANNALLLLTRSW